VEDIKLNAKIQALENKLQHNRKEKDRAEREKRPLSCNKVILEQNGIHHSNLDFQPNPQHDTSSDAILMGSSTINDIKTLPIIPLPMKYIKNPLAYIVAMKEEID
jgi:hypothetical protein